MSLPPKNERSALESIEHELYDPRVKIADTEIHHTRSHKKTDLPTSWGDDAPIFSGREEKGFSFGMKLFLLSTVLLIAALGFSIWRVVSLRNVVSSANIDMSAEIVPFIEGGEPTPLTVTLRNRNKSALENVTVTLLYKQGNSSQDEQEKIQEKKDLGGLVFNETKKQEFTVSLYGSEAESRDLAVKLEYRVPGSNALFSKVATARVILKAPPVAVSIAGPEKISVGQNGTYSVTVKNNSATTSPPQVLQVILPQHFTLESIVPKPVARSTAWEVESLAPGGTKIITITGSFDDKQGDTGVFVAKAGSVGETPTSIGIVYSSKSLDVALRASPLVLGVTLSSLLQSGEAILYGDTVTLTLSYSNVSSQALDDVSLTLILTGDAAVYGAIDPGSGYYDSEKKTITWTKASAPDLAVIPPNSRGELRVTIPIVPKGNNSPTLKVLFTGDASTKASEDITSIIAKTWGVRGSATLEAFTQYKNSSFENSGPVPPRPNQSTTYTVRLKLSAQNTLSSARASFVLPAYVSWRGVVSDPTTILYDAKTRTVTWSLGRVEQGASAVADIGLTVKPSQSHVGQAPVITSGIILDAQEEVSLSRLRTTLSPLTTAVASEEWPENPSLVVEK